MKLRQSSLGTASGLDVVTESVPVEAGAATSLSLHCPDGKRIISALAFWKTSQQAVQVHIGPNCATAHARNPSGSTADVLYLKLVCVSAG